MGRPGIGAIDSLRADVLETDGAAPVWTAEERNPAPAQQTSPAEPDRARRRSDWHRPITGRLVAGLWLLQGHQLSVSSPRSVILNEHT